LSGGVQEPLAGEPMLAAWTQDERKPEPRRQRGDAPLQRQDFLPKLRLCPLRFIETDNALDEAPSHPRAVDRGTPRPVARRISPVRRTSSLSRWS
jgi:hypothetical protein